MNKKYISPKTTVILVDSRVLDVVIPLDATTESTKVLSKGTNDWDEVDEEDDGFGW